MRVQRPGGGGVKYRLHVPIPGSGLEGEACETEQVAGQHEQ